MTEELYALLEDLASRGARSADGLVLPVYKDPHSVSQLFTKLAKRLGIKDVTFHTCRHDVASTLTMNGVLQRTLMEILGHKDPRMTVRYQHLAPGHLREAMGKLSR